MSNYNINNSSSISVAKNAVFAIVTTVAINAILLLVIHYLRQTDVKEIKQYDLKEINLTKIKKIPLNPVMQTEPPKPKKRIKPKPKLLKRKLTKPPSPMSPISMKPLSLNLNMNLLPMNSLSVINVSIEPIDENQITDSPETDSNLFDLSHVDQQPVPVSRRDPQYPIAAKQLDIKGWVDVEFIVDENGNVVDVEVVNSSSHLFHKSVTTAVYNWKFKPAVKDQQMVPTRCRQRLTFN